MGDSGVRVLVTGGAGYVGSHAAKALRGAGFVPVTLDDLRTGHEWAVKFGPFVRGEIADRALVERVIREERVEAVMHFAAAAYVRESLELPEKYYANNVAGSVALLEACLKTRVKAFVLSSTCAVYGVPATLPIVESSPTQPINAYGDTKLAIERMLYWYGRAHDLRWASLRYFNAAGADPDGVIGEVHDPETHIIPLLLQAARGERGPVTILGTDHPTPDGTPIRDYVHVSDLAEAHVRTLRYLLDGGTPRAFNLGTGHGASVREVVQMVERVTGRPVPITTAPRSVGDPPVLVADPSETGRVLGWKATHSELEQVVRTAALWEERKPKA
jgi:UDP-arabinose 4-epimerase